MAFMEILYAAGLLLLFAKIFGSIANRLGISSLVGEVFAGMLLGPVLGWVIVGDFLSDFIMLGAILLLFLAGMEVKYEDLKKNTYTASALAVSGGMLSFLFGFLVGWLIIGDAIAGMAVGVILLTTSNGTLFRIMMRTGQLKTRIGKIIVASTIGDDVLGIIALAVFFAFVTSGAFIVVDAAKIFLVAVGFYVFTWTAVTRLVNGFLRAISNFIDSQILFAVSIAIAFLLAYITDNLGLSIATGAFLAGMTMANSQFTETIIIPKVNTLGFGFLIPLFYAVVGTFLTLANVDVLLLVLFLVAAILGKLIGAILASPFASLSVREARYIGIMLMPRGNENIVIAQIVFSLGVISLAVYTSLIYALIVTVLLTPILARMIKNRR